MMLLLDVLVALRTALPNTTPPPAYTLEDLLARLRFALLDRFDDYDRLVAAARVDVPAMYGPRHLTQDGTTRDACASTGQVGTAAAPSLR